MKDILVRINNFESWSPGETYAAGLAANFEATLTGVYICPPPNCMAPELVAYVVEAARELEETAYAARAAFIARAHQLGVHNVSWQVAEGYVPHVLEHIGNWHDLLVLERSTDSLPENPSILGHSVLTAGLPCLITPPGASMPSTLDCIALAWNESPEAIRAIHAARPFLARAKRVVVLRGERKDALSDLGWKPPFELSGYLLRHGIHSTEEPLALCDEDAGPALLNAAKAVGADLLVMGAYGRTRFSEWIFGGATRHMLGHADIAVFMRH